MLLEFRAPQRRTLPIAQSTNSIESRANSFTRRPHRGKRFCSRSNARSLLQLPMGKFDGQTNLPRKSIVHLGLLKKVQDLHCALGHDAVPLQNAHRVSIGTANGPGHRFDGELSQSRFSETSRHNICIEHYVDQCHNELFSFRSHQHHRRMKFGAIAITALVRRSRSENGPTWGGRRRQDAFRRNDHGLVIKTDHGPFNVDKTQHDRQ